MKTVGELKKVLRQRGLLQENTENFKNRQAQENDRRCMDYECAGSETSYTESEADPRIDWLTFDSRTVREHTAFICKGAAFRPEYLEAAAQNGAVCYISETPIAQIETDGAAPLIPLFVTDIRKAMAAASAWFFDYEKGRPILTGITGTKGKTTTAWYLKAMLDEWEKELGEPETGLISTVENYDGVSRSESVMTTPEAPTLHEHILHAKQKGIRYMTMEVSSQALKYRRVRELQFQVGIFLNISRDHISPKEHVDFEDYFSSKLSLFRQTEVACVNLNADHADRILKAAHKAERIVTFGTKKHADIRCSEIRTEGRHLSFRVTCDRFSERFELGMRGKFNIENALAAITAAYVYGVPVACMRRALRKTLVPGRMETFVSSDGRICGIVDFAHNRLSFEKLFDAAFQEYIDYRRIITVFGCPGGKALNRRRELGIIAGLFSDEVILTTDDPCMEDPEGICEEIREYVDMTGCSCHLVTDRKKAVEQAVALAKEDRKNRTLILLLGRGSERFQQIGGRSLASPTDAELMAEALQAYDASRKPGEASCSGKIAG